MIETEAKEKLDEIFSRYSGERGELIPILQEAQGQFRYLPSEAMLGIAKFLRLSESTVFGVATFYAQKGDPLALVEEPPGIRRGKGQPDVVRVVVDEPQNPIGQFEVDYLPCRQPCSSFQTNM